MGPPHAQLRSLRNATKHSTWRDTSFALVLLSGLYLLLAALAAYGFGGCVAGRWRTNDMIGASDDTSFHDGMHGLISWSLSTLLISLLAAATLRALPRVTAPSISASAPSVPGESIIADDLGPSPADRTTSPQRAARLRVSRPTRYTVAALQKREGFVSDVIGAPRKWARW
jgi:hypothetical protein